MASSEAQMKRIIAIVLNKIAPEVPLTMMRGVGLRMRPRKPQWGDVHGSLNGILFSMSQCISVESLVKIYGKIREIYQFKFCPNN